MDNIKLFWSIQKRLYDKFPCGGKNHMCNWSINEDKRIATPNCCIWQESSISESDAGHEMVTDITVWESWCSWVRTGCTLPVGGMKTIETRWWTVTN